MSRPIGTASAATTRTSPTTARGYIACTATPATLRADFKVLDRVTVRNQPIRVGGSLVVEAGRPGGTAD
jgi:hypothetical protein